MTNVGATVAALTGMAPHKVVLIAGGQGKGGDFTPLRQAALEQCRAVVLIGEDAPLIAAALGPAIPLQQAASMVAAVAAADQLAQPGDVVLLSPACASFDMFKNYVDRGEQFVAAVREITA
ncbi:MAG: hypothetical protein HQL49_13700 [Gammaproteobacteria bacterium]|nr:hypothetical protein [Gammaproteobacteria bacterium]